MSTVAVVVIGRNEGERLKRCLGSVSASGRTAVYVDSGSTDGSVAVAKALGCEVVELDSSQPFTAARARNEGVAWVGRHRPDAAYVQLLDGDTELSPGWIEKGVAALESGDRVCASFGRLHERQPEASVYNRICDLEWKLPVGEVHCFGGITLVRVRAFLDVGGFNAGLIAGEEPEFSQRLRRAGWRILSVDADMALHDAGITRFGQWWKRSMRSGHAYAQVCWMGSGVADRFGLRQSLRTWFWVCGVPALSAASVLLDPLAPLAGVALLLLQSARIGIGIKTGGASGSTALTYGLLWFPTQLAQWFGQLKFAFSLLFGRKSRLIEYKAPVPGGTGGPGGPA